MGKRLSDIQEKVETAAMPFLEYLYQTVDKETLAKIEEISHNTRLFVFSGVIRNFFLKKRDIRDIDVVLEDEVDVESIFRNYEIRKNSYGGYKIKVGNLKIDLWFLEHTWALKHQPVINIDLKEHIPNTAFFNFSAVIYSYNEKRFVYTKEFLRFLRDKKIDFVYKPNANNSLCVVNTFYYSDKYNLKIADRLKRYIIDLHKSGNRDYESVQIKHFGEVLYTNKDIENRVFSLFIP